jgi:hypothetical protein
MKKKFVIILLASRILSGCNTEIDTITGEPEEYSTTEELEIPDIYHTVEHKEIRPLPSTLDINNLTECTVNVSFSKDSVIQEESKLYMKVYDYEVFDMVDISTLDIGDTIIIRDVEVKVNDLETLKSGLLFINGGIENDGYDLWCDNGVYFEHGYNDVKSFYPIGDIVLPLAENFIYIDSSDLDKGDIELDKDNFLEIVSDKYYEFTEINTKAVISNGEIIKIVRNYVP